MKKIISSIAIFGCLSLLFCAAAIAQNETWPSRNIRLIVGYSPGGTTDIAARLVAERLSARLGKQVIIENRAGAGGTVATLSVVRAEPDGYTLLMAAAPEVSIAPFIIKGLAYDPLVDLQPVAMVGSVPFLLVAHPQLPVNTVAELITYARANPGKLNYSSFGENTTNHFAGELFKSLTQINTLHVPYKGSGPSIIDLISGQIQYSFDAPAAVMEQVRGGRLKALAIAGTQRLSNAPNIPTFAEQGLPTFTAGTWFGILAPNKTQQIIVDRLNAEVNAVLALPELLKVFADRDIVPAGGTAQAFRAFIVSETTKWKKLALEVGIRAL